ncbi:MAG: Rieske 2Fe-2S domain-containing protein [Brevibacterium linens]|uniref:Rieske (2Fe-2S) protein n=1 Tax=Brevibacterium linens TaxID=1703 RepID=UPI003F94A57F
MTTTPSSPAEVESTATADPTRRRVMKTAGVAGTVAVIGGSVAATSGCSPEEEEAAKTQDANLPAADVPVGSGTVIEDTYVITQPKEGEFFAFSSVCTHQGCQVTRITEEAIICPCHSSNFSVTTGEVISGPAEEPLPKYEVSESGGTLTVKGK